MNAHIYRFLFPLILFLMLAFVSCKSSFPPDGTIVYCNGTAYNPILNPTIIAQFKGGKDEMFRFVKSNFRLPKELNGMKISGKIRIAFMITREGKVCDVRITSKPQKYLDEEFIRVFEIMPNWEPGVFEGRIVDSYYLIDFKLK